MPTTLLDKEKRKWIDLPVKERSQILLAAFLIIAAVILVFTCFLMTLEVGASVLAASGEFLASALALLGLTLIVKNSLIDIQTKVQKHLKDED